MVAVEKKAQRYDAYKDSGVEWLGEIPEHWEIKKLKLSIKKIIDNRGRTPIFGDIGTPMLEIRNITNGLKNPTEDFQKYVLPEIVVKYERDKVHIDDVLISTVGATSGKVVIINKKPKYFIAQNVIGIRFTKMNNPLFVYFFLRSEYFISSLQLINKGNTIDNLKVSVFVNNICFFPPLPEQTKIAQFLDDKTTKIDDAIAIKQQQINLLKERKQILIHKAVTRGLDDSVTLKDSGVEWIGEIPEHWEVKRFRYVFNLGKGLTITKDNLREEGVFCVNYGEIHSKYGFELDTKIHKLKCVDKDYLLNNPSALINYGDFVFADTSEDIEGSGNFTYLESKDEIFAGYHTVVAKPKLEIESRFFAYIFESESFRNQIRTKVKGVKVFSITQSILKEPTVWYPSKNEQKEIVDYLDSSTKKIETAISLKQQEIAKLKEYKSSLINGVVTGKVRVC